MNDLSDLKVPGPTITQLTAPFWDAAEAGRLHLQHCEACQRAVFYPRRICPHCWSDRLVWREASGRGHLKSFSIVHRPGHPGWAPAAPYVVGLVELAEGPTMLSLVLDEAPSVGMALRLRPTRVGDRRLPAFEVVPTTDSPTGDTP